MYAYFKLITKTDPEVIQNELFKLSPESLMEIEDIFKKLEDAHEGGNTANITDQEKGKLLEKIVDLILFKTNIFKIYKNVRNNVNEIDLIVKLSDHGITFNDFLINELKNDFICECKNYNKSISVTWVGKFFSLLNIFNQKFGIIFSYYPVTGRGEWTDSKGLIKKIFLRNETVILNFCSTDIRRILKGDKIQRILSDKLDNLKYQTEIQSYISKHPYEEDSI